MSINAFSILTQPTPQFDGAIQENNSYAQPSLSNKSGLTSVPSVPPQNSGEGFSHGTINDDESAVLKFFTDDNGRVLLPDKPPIGHGTPTLGILPIRTSYVASRPLSFSRVSTMQSTTSVETIASESPTLRPPLSRVSSMISTLRLSRLLAMRSASSVNTVVGVDSVRDLELEELCRVIDEHVSMQQAEIVSAEGYKEWTGSVIHRYLVLELRRNGKKTIWLRIDRRRSRDVSLAAFFAMGATTPANDVAKLSAKKNKLIVGGDLETRQRFSAVPTLGDLRHLFRVIRDELQRYELWPANCWFFVSLLHEHLGAAGDGVFLRGKLRNPQLALDIRQTVKQRMRVLYDIPDPIAVAQLFGINNYVRDVSYRNAILQYFDPANTHSLTIFRSIIGYILCAEEPLLLRTLVELLLSKSKYAEQQQSIRRFILLLTGTDTDDFPIERPHQPFSDFLCNPNRSGPFFIDIRIANADMVLACLHIITAELHFNICQLPTSFKGNRDIENLDALVQSHISPQLLYACWYLMHHIAKLTTFDATVMHMISSFFKEHLLSWLEVMSVTQGSFVDALYLLPSSQMMKYTTSEVMILIYDAVEFARFYVEPITRSAAHIYLSALAFDSNTVHKHFSPLFPSLVKVEQSWPTSYLVCIKEDEEPNDSAASNNNTNIWDVRTGCRFLPPVAWHGEVNSVAFHPGGTQVVSGSDDGTLRFWDVETGANVGFPLQGHTSFVRCVAFSPDGTLLASGSSDTTLRIWDVRTGASIGEPLEGHHDAVLSVAFSPDGTQLVSGSFDCSLQIWDVRTGARVGKPLRGHTSAVWSVAFSPDGTRIVSGSADESLQLWDVRTGTRFWIPLRGHASTVRSVAFSPDSSQIASGSQDKLATVQFWDVRMGARTGKPLRHTRGVTCIAFSPDGTQLVSGSFGCTLQIWDVRTGANVGEPLIGHTHAVLSVAFSPDGTKVVSGSADGTLRLWNLSTGDSKTEWSRDSRYPAKLFPHRSFRIEDNWMLGPKDELIIWLSPDSQNTLKRQTSRVFGTSYNVELDFRNFKCGEEWARCQYR